MSERTRPEFVEAYRRITELLKEKVGERSLQPLFRRLAKELGNEIGGIRKIFVDGREPKNATLLLEESARFISDKAVSKGKLELTFDLVYRHIREPVSSFENASISSSSIVPDMPDERGDEPNISPASTNNVADLASFEIFLTGDNYNTSLGRSLILELYFGRLPQKYIHKANLTKTYDLYMNRCRLALTLDSAISDRADERTIEDNRNADRKIKISESRGTSRGRFWDISHVETDPSLSGIFQFDLCKIEQALGHKDRARLLATPANIGVDFGGRSVGDSEQEQVIAQLVKLRKMDVMNDGRIVLSEQKLLR